MADDPRISVIVRTRNEERNIMRFCDSYTWANDVLIADALSNDDTPSLALDYDNVRIRNFAKFTPMENNHWRNPAGEHINFLLDWADELRADWVIFDDCDCVPNPYLISDALDIIKHTKSNAIYVTRLYLWGEDEHFPELAKPSGDWSPSLWAWRANTGLRFTTNKVNHTHEMMFRFPEEEVLKLMPPYCLLHRPWPDEETLQKKLKFYRESGQHPHIKHPKEVYELEPLPEWANEDRCAS